MLNNLSDTEQEEAELRYLFGEALSEYLQGYAYEQGPPAFDTLETASLNLGDDTPRQGFKNGGLTGFGAVPEAIAGLGFNIATKSNPFGIALSLANLASVVFSEDNKSITDRLGITDPTGVLGPLGFPGNITYGSYPTGIEEEAPLGITTSLEDRQENIDQTGTATGLGISVPGTQGGITSAPNTDFPPDDPQEVDVFSTPSINMSIPADTNVAAAAAGQGVAPGGAATTSGQDAVGATGTGATGISAESGFGGGEAGPSGPSGDTGDGGSGDAYSGGAKDGGQIKGYRHGDLVEDDQADTQLDNLGLGPIGVVNDLDGTTGVADDLDMDLPDKSYVLNAEAVRLAGIGPINTMIKKAIDLAIEDGVDLPNEIKTAEKIPIRISKGEAVLPHPLDIYIGRGKLKKMNDRGLRVREQRESEEAPVQMAAAPSPQEDLLAQIQPVA